jgi:dipeptidyl aminopeptidase/acylaminoacyl peptidase
MSYLYHDLDGYGVRVRDVKTGKETSVVQTSDNIRAKISPDGSAVAYSLSTFTNEKERVIYLVPAAGGDARKLCEDCGLLYDWSPDGKKILYRSGNPMRFSTIEVATGRRTEIVAHPKFGVYDAVLSPDQHWLAIHYGAVDSPQALFIAPAGADCVAGPQNEWIVADERPGGSARPWRSPDGNLLYYESGAIGHTGIWARRLERGTKQPKG